MRRLLFSLLLLLYGCLPAYARASAVTVGAVYAGAPIGTPVLLGDNTTTTSATIVTTTSSPSATGNLIFAVTGLTRGSTGSNTVSGVADQVSNSYVNGNSLLVSIPSFAGVIRPAFAVNAVALPSADTVTSTLSTNAQLADAANAAISVSGISSVDQQPVGSAATTSTPSVTSSALAASNEIAFGYLWAASSGSAPTITEASGWTTLLDITVNTADKLHIAYKKLSSNAAVTYNPTESVATGTAINLVTFKGF